MLTSFLYAATLLTAILLSWLNGTRPERRVALVLLAGNLATIATLLLSQGHDFTYVSAAYLAVDILGTVALCWIAIRHPSWMTVLVATFQVNGTLGHAVKLVSPETMDLSYAILLRLWGWPMVLTAIVARFKPGMRRILRQSDLMGMPAFLRPPITPAGLAMLAERRSETLNRNPNDETADQSDMEQAPTEPRRPDFDARTSRHRPSEIRKVEASRRATR
jgi:hypothetical protein